MAHGAQKIYNYRNFFITMLLMTVPLGDYCETDAASVIR